jgi:hypothetical protein
MIPAMTWGAGSRSGGAAKPRPVRAFPAKAGGARSAHDFSFGSKRLPLFTDVVLIGPLHAEGESLPAGASGTVVEVLRGGAAYIVEFFRPRHCVVTVHDHALARHGA